MQDLDGLDLTVEQVLEKLYSNNARLWRNPIAGLGNRIDVIVDDHLKYFYIPKENIFRCYLQIDVEDRDSLYGGTNNG